MIAIVLALELAVANLSPGPSFWRLRSFAFRLGLKLCVWVA
jgi:hypothetical protein